jgi:hypothetical protein
MVMGRLLPTGRRMRWHALAVLAFSLAGCAVPKNGAAQQPSRCARDFLALVPLVVMAATPPSPPGPVSVDVEAIRASAVLFCGEQLSDATVRQAVGAELEDVPLREFSAGTSIRVEGVVDLGHAVEVVVRYSSIQPADAGGRYGFTLYRLTFERTINGYRFREKRVLMVT